MRALPHKHRNRLWETVTDFKSGLQVRYRDKIPAAWEHNNLSMCLWAIPPPERLTLKWHWLLTGRNTVCFTALYCPETHTLCFVRMSSDILHPAFLLTRDFHSPSLTPSFALSLLKDSLYHSRWRRSRRRVNRPLTPRWRQPNRLSHKGQFVSWKHKALRPTITLLMVMYGCPVVH